METLKNAIKIIKDVEMTHRNLGLSVVFCKLIDIADMGCLIVAERGRGKGAILSALEQLRHRDVLIIGRLTPAGLAKVASKLDGKNLTLINPDLTSLVTPYLKDAAINVIAHLLFDRRMPQSWTAQYSYSIEHCVISFFGGVQPRLLKELQGLQNWESMYKDRFIRFYIIYPFGTPEYKDKNPEVGEITIVNCPLESVSIPDEIRKDPKYNRLKEVIKFQTSEGRCGMYLDRLLRASAVLNERTVVLKDDLDFLELFIPYLELEFWLSERESLAEPFRINVSSYVMLFYLIENYEATRKELMKHFNVSKATVMRALEPLREKKIISGGFGGEAYYINPEWYKKYIQPIIDFGKAIGIV